MSTSQYRVLADSFINDAFILAGSVVTLDDATVGREDKHLQKIEPPAKPASAKPAAPPGPSK